MANLKEVRTRISSVKSTQQITKAMKMVSAAKLRRAQQAITKIRPYSKKLSEMLSDILDNLEGEASTRLNEVREVQSALIVVITSSKGLCGAFNSNIIKAAKAQIEGKYAELHKAGKLDMLFIGKKGSEFYKKRYLDINQNHDHVDLFSDLTFDNSAAIAANLMEAFENGTYDAIDVAYAGFKNAAVQEIQATQFLPVAKIEKGEEKGKVGFNPDFIFEPSKEELLETLVPSILKLQFHRYSLETHASEHGARMTAMDKATENADDLLRELKIFYNKARQEAITNELSEIVGGAAALEGN